MINISIVQFTCVSLMLLEWTKLVWTQALGLYLWVTHSVHVKRNYVPLFGVTQSNVALPNYVPLFGMIRYYLPRLKLSSSTIALARERTPSIHKMYQQFQPMVWPNLWDAGPVIVHFIIEFTSYRDALQWRGSNIKKLHMLLQYIIDNFWWQVMWWMWWRKLSRTADDQSLTGMKLNMICLHVCAMLPFGQ